MDRTSKTFCILPFTHISTSPSGDVQLCCRAKVSSHANINNPEFDLEEYWNSDFLNQVRTDLLSGVRNKHCRHCWKSEDRGVLSQRQTRGQGEEQWAAQGQENIDQFINEGKIDYKISLLELKLSNVCNMKCRMCWPKDSSIWYSDWDKIKHLHVNSVIDRMDSILDKSGRLQKPFETNGNIKNQLYKVLDYVDQIEFAGGEPTIDPLHLEIISKIKNPENVVLKYSTNLHQINDKLIEVWKKFKEIKLTISIDGYEKLNEKIRRGSDWAALKHNINRIRSEFPNISEIKGSTCISALNVLELAKTFEAITEELQIRWHVSMVTYPDFLSADILPKEKLQESLDQLEIIEARLNSLTMILENEQSRLFTKFNLRHITSSIKYIKSCIEHNKHEDGNSQVGTDINNFKNSFNVYEEYNRIIDQIDNGE